jgi:hypothetical protein
MDLQEEEDVAGFLGVHIDRTAESGKAIILTQKGLIERIIDALDIFDQPAVSTPAKVGVLPKDVNGDEPNGTFSYPSVIGMMLYLSSNSRPDITFAVSQCARFSQAPRRSHEEALQRIGRYLKGTRDKGLILHPAKDDETFSIDVYVDADFAGGWGYEDPHDPVCVKSRTGYVIEIMGCPVVWVSKLQTEIATSTMEAEYSALSMAMRAAIPLIEVCKAVIRGLKLKDDSVTKFKTVIHEDNQGCIALASLEPGRQTPRSKFYAIKMHWFRSWLRQAPHEISIEYIETNSQKADMLTKALTGPKFIENRKLTLGW